MLPMQLKCERLLYQMVERLQVKGEFLRLEGYAFAFPRNEEIRIIVVRPQDVALFKALPNIDWYRFISFVRALGLKELARETERVRFAGTKEKEIAECLRRWLKD